jgi:hypothetical protein
MTRKLELRKQARAAVPPPMLPPERPRSVRLTATGRFVAVIGVLLPVASLITGFWLWGVAAESQKTRRRLSTEGISAQAVIYSLWRTSGDNRKYYANYRYTAAGASHAGRASFSRSTWSKLREGDTLTVRYLPEAPHRAWARGAEPNVPIWAGPLTALALGLLAVVPWHAIRGQWTLLSEGRAARAQVKLSRKVRHKHGTRYEVFYEFQSLEGGVRTGTYNTQRTIPEPGATIQVVYDPDNVKRSRPYPFELVRPA